MKMTPNSRRLLTTACVATAFSAVSFAQGTGNAWVEFEKDNSRLVASNSLGLGDDEEKDYAVGDLDKDGWEDLVCVRKSPFTSSGHRVNVLFMNENGVLTDRTAQYASASDVGGDQGFQTPTNDRDVRIGDLNNDGWDDVVTATTLGAGMPQHISHPRVYMNLGNDGSGNWLGLRHEAARIPQLLLSNGSPSYPRFCSVDIGDVTGDGFADLYFGDYDSGGSGGGDMNDRLLINDGTGHFVDQSTMRMTAQMLDSAFGNSVVIEDMNLDGVKDIVKDTALNAPQYVAVSYNDPDNEGVFDLFDEFHNFAPYHVNVGDLNQDGRPDVVVSDDASDRFRFNTGTDIFGRVTWSSAKTFQFVSGGDDGFASNNYIEDLDNDGWPDVLIADVDVDISGCNRRTHIYRNKGGNPGQLIDLIEEAQNTGSSGWKGVVGMTGDDLKGTHDIATFDIDRDGDLDMVFGLCTGTNVWMNTLDPPMGDVGTAYCFGDGSGGACPCGNAGGAGEGCANSSGSGGVLGAGGSDSAGSDDLVLEASNLLTNQPALAFVGLDRINGGNGVSFGDGLRCAGTSVVRLGVDQPDGAGNASWGPGLGSLGNWGAGDVRRFQIWYRNPAGGPCSSGFNLTNGLEVTFGQ